MSRKNNNSSLLTTLFSKFEQPFFFLVLLGIGVMVLLLRNPDPLLNPVIYTEDGTWIGLALTKGWWYAFQNAKAGYFVWGNLILLWASVNTSSIVCGNPLICLPQSIAFFSFFFFSSIASLSFFATRELLPIWARASLFLVILLIPLGDSSNEILGRISNIGYFIVVALVLLLFIRLQHKKRLVIDILLLLCVSTNPVSIPLLYFYLVFVLFYEYKSFESWGRSNMFLISGLSILTVLIGSRFVGMHDNAVTGSLQLENLVEVFIARSLLFPFFFWAYNSLSDAIVLIIGTAWVALSIWLWLQKEEAVKLFSGIVFIAFVVYSSLTFIMRQSLTQQLGGYKNTFPDRYFMGLNALVILFFFLLAAGESKQIIAKIVGRWVLLIVLGHQSQVKVF